MRRIRLNSRQFKSLVTECVKRALNEAVVDMPDDADTDYWRAEDAEGDLDDNAQLNNIDKKWLYTDKELNGDPKTKWAKIHNNALDKNRDTLGRYNWNESPNFWWRRMQASNLN